MLRDTFPVNQSLVMSVWSSSSNYTATPEALNWSCFPPCQSITHLVWVTMIVSLLLRYSLSCFVGLVRLCLDADIWQSSNLDCVFWAWLSFVSSALDSLTQVWHLGHWTKIPAGLHPCRLFVLSQSEPRAPTLREGTCNRCCSPLSVLPGMVVGLETIVFVLPSFCCRSIVGFLWARWLWRCSKWFVSSATGCFAPLHGICQLYLCFMLVRTRERAVLHTALPHPSWLLRPSVSRTVGKLSYNF